MRREIGTPWIPFAVAGCLLVIVSVALFRLPESLVAQMSRNRFLSEPQARWAFRLMLGAALGQAAFVGFFLLRIERLERRLPAHAHAVPAEWLVGSLARSAAVMSLLTVLYGMAAFAVTGERGGYWAFVALTVGQLAWYFRQVGDVASWLRLQKQPASEHPAGTWHKEPDDYCPPLARGFRP